MIDAAANWLDKATGLTGNGGQYDTLDGIEGGGEILVESAARLRYTDFSYEVSPLRRIAHAYLRTFDFFGLSGAGSLRASVDPNHEVPAAPELGSSGAACVSGYR